MQIAFALTFFVCRLVIGPFVTWTALQTPSTSMIVKVTCSAAAPFVKALTHCIDVYPHVLMSARSQRVF